MDVKLLHSFDRQLERFQILFFNSWNKSYWNIW